MKANYDFSKASRGAVLPAAGNKVRITIRLDRAIIDWFKARVEAQGGGNYQTMLNDALHAFIGRQAAAGSHPAPSGSGRNQEGFLTRSGEPGVGG